MVTLGTRLWSRGGLLIEVTVYNGHLGTMLSGCRTEVACL